MAPVGTPAPPIQKTLEGLAPLIKIIFDCAPTVNAPPNLNTKTASELLLPSNVRVPAKDPAPAIE
jgi:hypothetical protein